MHKITDLKYDFLGQPSIGNEQQAARYAVVALGLPGVSVNTDPMSFFDDDVEQVPLGHRLNGRTFVTWSLLRLSLVATLLAGGLLAASTLGAVMLVLGLGFLLVVTVSHVRLLRASRRSTRQARLLQSKMNQRQSPTQHGAPHLVTVQHTHEQVARVSVQRVDAAPDGKRCINLTDLVVCVVDLTSGPSVLEDAIVALQGIAAQREQHDDERARRVLATRARFANAISGLRPHHLCSTMSPCTEAQVKVLD